ncbi:cytochrome c [Tumebacillus sp. DT12]|uniref:Cytochrome c n=1 Tax=Tumebacillus lacus TaxID=2995335 RepID=A0ABT3WYW4_9BACL|nr:cytochrome c [Tumebacillus lacus]MCX7568898.1 cytochrome c [Tumebacillus lacus]
MSVRGLLLVLFLFAMGVTFSGVASYSSTVIQHHEKPEISGEKLAAQNCASCHGKDFKGGAGPSLVDRGSKLSSETIAQIIKDGVGGDMPGGIIKDEKEIQAVAKYITTLGE